MAGLYLHIPFCSQRCVYCDFYFVTTSRNTGAFVEAMRTEIEAYGRSGQWDAPLRTLYLGGGTPSLLPLDETARLIEAVHQHFDTGALEEVTVEVNPEDATTDYLGGLRALGVTRLSLGVQSFFDDDLRAMNRVHDARQAEAAIEAIQRTGFDSYSVDLIFGIPGQPPEYWMANLERAARLGVPHLSTYGLTIEERTPLFKMVELGRVTPQPDEALRERFLDTMEYLAHQGYTHYEVSSFALPGARSRHNQLYWNHADYLGLGPSAHSFRRESTSRARRWSNVRNLKQYEALLRQGRLPLDTSEALTLDDLAEEFVLLRLRLLEDGLDLGVLEERYGVDLLTDKLDELAELERRGLVTFRNQLVRLTREGAVVADAVTSRLLPTPIS